MSKNKLDPKLYYLRLTLKWIRWFFGLALLVIELIEKLKRLF